MAFIWTRQKSPVADADKMEIWRFLLAAFVCEGRALLSPPPLQTLTHAFPVEGCEVI